MQFTSVLVSLLTWTPQISTPTSISLEAFLRLSLIWVGLLEQFVFAGKWRAASVFPDLYLKSLSFFSEKLYGLALLVAFNTYVQLPDDL